ncbi:phosphatase PAP2 family protein [Ruania albidiflava]|uniref:phosphatase PAP2 family protein n=1 Tax=Ruania albidiflava TaxID=366586 RepID=UPI0003F5984A|nr:phosphatase PAP2 family protein [Ruania albidiflava]
MTTVLPTQSNAAPPSPEHRSTWPAVVARLCAAVVCAALVLVLHQLFVATGPGQRWDESFALSVNGSDGPLSRLGLFFLREVSPLVLLGALVVAVLVALARRRAREAVGAVLLMLVANVSTQVLKHFLLDRPDLGVTYDLANSFPSGHTTAATTVLAVLVLAAPRGWRPVVLAVGGLYPVLCGWGTLVDGWHRPSDVLAAFAVVATWYFLVRAVLLWSHPEPEAQR